MALDLYSPCPCDSGKKLKWCCAELVPVVVKIVRLLQDQQYTHAERAIADALRDHPDHPLLLTLKLDAILADQCFREVHPDEVLRDAHRLMRQRPQSLTAHRALAAALTDMGDAQAVVAALQDYLEMVDRLGRKPTVEIITSYLGEFPWSSRIAQLFLAWSRRYGRMQVILDMAGRGHEGTEEFLERYSAAVRTLSGISNCPWYVPDWQNAGLSEAALRAIEQAEYEAHALRFRQAVSILAPFERKVPAIALLTVLYRVFTGRMSLPLLLALPYLFQEPQQRMIGWVVMQHATAIWEATCDLAVVMLSEEMINSMQEQLDQTHTMFVSKEGDLRLFVPKQAVEGEAPLDPRRIAWAVVSRTQDAAQRGILFAPEPQELMAEGGRRLLESLLDAKEGSIFPMSYAQLLVDTVQLIMRLVAEERREDLARRAIRFAKEQWTDLMLWAKLDEERRGPEFWQATALVLERTQPSSGFQPRRLRLWYEEFGVPMPRFAYHGRPGELAWLACIDPDQSDPEALCRLLRACLPHGPDIACELAESLLGNRYESFEPALKSLALIAHVSWLSELVETPAVEQLAKRLEEACQQQLWPAGLVRLTLATLECLRLPRNLRRASAAEQERAATALQRLVRDHTGGNLADLLKVILHKPEVLYSGVEQTPLSKQDAEMLVHRLGQRLLDTLEAMGLIEVTEKDWQLDRLMPVAAEPPAQTPPEPHGRQLIFGFSALSEWLARFARTVITAPSETAAKPELWTPDDQGHGTAGKKLWLPGES